MMECAWTILGEQVHSWTHGALSDLGLRAHVQGGFDPHQRETAQDDPVLQQLSGQRGRSQQFGWRGGGRSPARNIYANRNRR
jgi:peptidoglycan/xylan/chitin deacetylase (PgdA/CDA1 family)